MAGQRVAIRILPDEFTKEQHHRKSVSRFLTSGTDSGLTDDVPRWHL